METIQNSSEESHNSHDFFSGLIENCPSKICSVMFSIFGSLLTSLIIYAIIWYEKNGSDLNRTMNNRLFVSCWFLLMFWYIVPQQIDTIRYITGPLPKPVCHFSVFMKFFVTMNTIVLVDISFIIRYLTIFWLNNPAGLNNEFWALFFNVWATLISFLTMFVLNFLPGKDFPDLWIWTGTDSNSDFQSQYKNKLGYNMFKYSSCFLSVIISLRIKYYKWKIAKENVQYHPRSKIFWLFSTDTNSVFDIIDANIYIIIIMATIFLNAPRNQIDLKQLNYYPFYQIEYFYTLCRMILTGWCLICAKFVSDKRCLKVLINEVKSFLDWY